CIESFGFRTLSHCRSFVESVPLRAENRRNWLPRASWTLKAQQDQRKFRGGAKSGASPVR
ncbi:MAG: hypothetical protein QHC89_04610, partial [Bosea sp. (in: a-proteobacteria)]|nr:hypothetical protein [Bosea sp. (in: a-proteobacteria)]